MKSTINQGKKTYSKGELSELYGVSTDTFRKWLLPLEKEISDLKSRKVFTPREVEMIFKLLGSPLE